MSGIGAAIVGGSVLTGFLSSQAQSSAADKAAQAQLAANQQALQAQGQNHNTAVNFQNNQQAQGNALAGNQQQQLQHLFAPFLAAGQQGIGGLNQFSQGGLQAFQQQGALAGSQGNAAQTQAISGLQNSPIFQALSRQGENAILQNAAATGGLRGGNTQAALAQFQPALLQQLIQQQFQNLGSLSGLGSQSTGALASLGQAGAQSQAQGGLGILQGQLGLGENVAGNVAGLSGGNASTVAQLLSQQGNIQGQDALAQGQAQANLFNGIGSSVNLAALLQSGALNRGGLGATAQSPLNSLGAGALNTALGSGGLRL